MAGVNVKTLQWTVQETVENILAFIQCCVFEYKKHVINV